jgi:hypothetical protein
MKQLAFILTIFAWTAVVDGKELFVATDGNDA